jgi:hypothetical protein
MCHQSQQTAALIHAADLSRGIFKVSILPRCEVDVKRGGGPLAFAYAMEHLAASQC